MLALNSGTTDNKSRKKRSKQGNKDTKKKQKLRTKRKTKKRKTKKTKKDQNEKHSKDSTDDNEIDANNNEIEPTPSPQKSVITNRRSPRLAQKTSNQSSHQNQQSKSIHIDVDWSQYAKQRCIKRATPITEEDKEYEWKNKKCRLLQKDDFDKDPKTWKVGDDTILKGVLYDQQMATYVFWVLTKFSDGEPLPIPEQETYKCM